VSKSSLSKHDYNIDILDISLACRPCIILSTLSISNLCSDKIVLDKRVYAKSSHLQTSGEAMNLYSAAPPSGFGRLVTKP